MKIQSCSVYYHKGLHLHTALLSLCDRESCANPGIHTSCYVSHALESKDLAESYTRLGRPAAFCADYCHRLFVVDFPNFHGLRELIQADVAAAWYMACLILRGRPDIDNVNVMGVLHVIGCVMNVNFPKPCMDFLLLFEELVKLRPLIWDTWLYQGPPCSLLSQLLQWAKLPQQWKSQVVLKIDFTSGESITRL